MEKLQKKIEAVRKKLDEASLAGLHNAEVYELSMELDELIAAFADLKEQQESKTKKRENESKRKSV